MIDWLSQFFPCTSKRQKPSPLPKPSTQYEIKLIDEATMFPSVQIAENCLNTDRQPDSEDINQSFIESPTSTASQADQAIPLTTKSTTSDSQEPSDLSHCKLCQKTAEGFCCACKTDKFCNPCFKISHKALPNYHLFFNFKQGPSDSSISQKVSSLTQKLTRNRTNL